MQAINTLQNGPFQINYNHQRTSGWDIADDKKTDL